MRRHVRERFKPSRWRRAIADGEFGGRIESLLVKEGDMIAADQYLMEVETDKAAVEIPSPYAGIARKIHVKEGQTVNVGAVVVTFDDGKAQIYFVGNSLGLQPIKTAELLNEELENWRRFVIEPGLCLRSRSGYDHENAFILDASAGKGAVVSGSA